MSVLILYKTMLGVSLILMFCIHVRINILGRSKNQEEMPILRWLSFGVNLSAMSYVFRIVEYAHPHQQSYTPTIFCVAGTIAITVGWMRLTEMIVKRKPAAAAEIRGDGKIESEEIGDQVWISALGLDEMGLKVTGLLGATVLLAVGEAERRGQCEVDTEHLLIGLLQEPYGLGRHILKRIGVDEKDLRAALTREAPALTREPRRTTKRVSPLTKDMPLDGEVLVEFLRKRLTGRCLDVFRYAAGEARRFNCDHVGTEHLLLGLALKGDGAAAHALLQCGANADRIRDEMMAMKPIGTSRRRTQQ